MVAAYVLLGLIAGALSGFFGIGGGVFLVPVLVLLFGLSQHQAQGTTLALLVLPIGFLAAYTYYKAGYVNVPMTVFIGAGFVVGGLIGAKYSVYLSEDILRKLFGVSLMLVALYMIFRQ